MLSLAKKYPLLIIILLCVLTRLPQLLSSNLILDGDECVVAIMAKHLLSGKDVSLFFYGQAYGFSLVETSFISVFYLVMGVSTLSVKLAMLTLWIMGVVFFYKTLTLISNNRTTVFILTLLLVSAPAWAVWAMKARGGYLTSFLLSNVVLYLSCNDKFSRSIFTHIVIGWILVFIYQSQALWLVGLLPLVIFQLYKHSSIKNTVAVISGILSLWICFYLYKLSLTEFYKPNFVIPAGELLFRNILRIPKYLYYTLHGRYFFAFIQKANPVTMISALGMGIVILMLPLAGIYLFFRERKKYALFILSTIGIASTLLYTIITIEIEPRYLLPVVAYALISVGILLNHMGLKKQVYGYSSMLIVTGIISVASFHNFSFTLTREQEFKMVLKELEKKNVRHLFCVNDWLTWQVLFYSDEKILCRGLYMPGRYPEYVSEINAALASGKPTAVFGEENGKLWNIDSYRLQFPDREIIMQKYYLVTNPGKATLEKTFRF